MADERFPPLPLETVPSPCYIVDEGLLQKNLEKLDEVREKSGCRILLALKGFSMYAVFPLVKKYLQGVCASSLNEARLGREKFGKEVHTFGAAYPPEDFKAILRYSDTLIFNSFSQWEHYKKVLPPDKKYGIRVNPGYSEIKTALYNPCAPFSRLGVSVYHFKGQDLSGLSGIHFHALCEQNADTLVRVLQVVEDKFSSYFGQLSWINFGGGHHITRPDYDTELLIRTIRDFRSRYPHLTVYLEPGEAIALNTGILVATVLDIVHNSMEIAVLDTSAETHMPDVLAMPYRPEVAGGYEPGSREYTYRLAGLTCLAGDVIGDYSFDKKLSVGDRIVFYDMAHYTMVKNTTFNGINLPSIILRKRDGTLKRLKKFGYADFKSRL
ncbi:MAG: carboxynorspermidine decarboxylase [Spirochaetales bacterium]|nr:carboxynorspermidine decarboxylase [Spirochaetales bacterium]